MANKDIFNKLELLHKDVKLIRRDLDYHIKRTDILESKVQKMWFLLAFLTGGGIIQFGKDILKIMGL